MTNNQDEQYVSPRGYTLACAMVQPDHNEGVWTLTVQMDQWREEKQSAIFYSSSFVDVEPTIQFGTETWVSSFWISPSGKLYACDGRSLWRGPPGQVTQQRVADRMVLKVWGYDEATVFILGTDGLVLRSSGDSWQDISIPDTVRLSDIHGTSPSQFFGVGENGAFWRLDGDSWTAIDLQTNANLRGVFVDGDEDVYICGEAATALRYRSGNLEVLATEQGRIFTGVRRYGENIYFGASGNGVDILTDLQVQPFKTTIYGQRIAASPKYLWSCGNNFIYRFDGNGWLKKAFL